ncbi:MAG TPA: glycosyltransferase family 39 protein [Bryobacteraceae bacterium]|jgi:hypothetical protein|nr:glycosyltransferase family 39 protein [Bryobacteraceae bacterium]
MPEPQEFLQDKPLEVKYANARAGGSRSAIIWAIIYFLASVAVILEGQYKSGVFTAELAHFPDEPAHAMTAIFFRDYFAALFPSPMVFAHNYYLHYPKIAIGIWPPFFYILGGTWLLLFGNSHASFLLFIATMGGALGATLSMFVRRLAGPWLGLLSGLLLLCLRPVRFGTTTMLVDTTMTLMCLLATLALVRYFDTERLRDAILFGVLTALAMLTKGNANELVLVVPFMIVVTGRYRLLMKRDLYLAAVVVAVLGLPWQYLSLRMLNNASLIQPAGSGVAANASGYLKILFEQLGYVSLAGAAVFAASWILCRKRALQNQTSESLSGAIDWLCEHETEIAGAGSLAVAVYVFHVFAPVPGPDGRYMMGALPPLIFLFCAGITFLARSAGPRRSVVVYIAAALLLLAMPANAWKIAQHDHLGMDTVAGILRDPSNRVILVDADATAEGGFIVSLALLDHRPEQIVIRSTKLMSDNPWTATVYRPRLTDPQQVRDVLDRVPVDAVVLDLTNPGWQQDSALLLRALRGDTQNWRLTNDFPVSPANSHHLQIFRNVRPRDRSATDAQLVAQVEKILSMRRY